MRKYFVPLTALFAGLVAFATDPPTPLVTPDATTGIYAIPTTDLVTAIGAGVQGFLVAFGSLLKANIMLIVSVAAVLFVVGLLWRFTLGRVLKGNFIGGK